MPNMDADTLVESSSIPLYLLESTKSLHHNEDMDEFFLSMKKDAEAATALASKLSSDVVKDFVDFVYWCDGTLLTSGIGKSGLVAQRMSASLSSTGTPAHYVHGAEWTHGDLGKGRRGDVCVFFSHSGNTRECVFAASHLRQRGVHILSVIGNDVSQLASCSDAYICYKVGDGGLDEPVGGAPTTSVVLQEMVVNAVLCELIRRRRFSTAEFARNHPGGSLGTKLVDNKKRKGTNEPCCR